MCLGVVYMCSRWCAHVPAGVHTLACMCVETRGRGLVVRSPFTLLLKTELFTDQSSLILVRPASSKELPASASPEPGITHVVLHVGVWDLNSVFLFAQQKLYQLSWLFSLERFLTLFLGAPQEVMAGTPATRRHNPKAAGADDPLSFPALPP